MERDLWSQFPSPTLDQISHDFGYVLETSVRGYHKASLRNPFQCCIALLVKKFLSILNLNQGPLLRYIVGNYWAVLDFIISVTTFQHAGWNQSSSPDILQTCAQDSQPSCKSSAWTSLVSPHLSWTGRPRAGHSSPVKPYQLKWKIITLFSFFFFFFSLFTEPIFSESWYQFCHVYTERVPQACIEPAAPHCPFGRTSMSVLLSQPVLDHGVVLPCVQYSKFLLVAIQEASSSLSWHL